MSSKPMTAAHILEIQFFMGGRLAVTPANYTSFTVESINPNMILDVLKWCLQESGKAAQEMRHCNYESYTSPVTNDTLYKVEIIGAFSYFNKQFVSHILVNHVLQNGNYRLVNKEAHGVTFEYVQRFDNTNNNNVELVEEQQAPTYEASIPQTN